MKINPNEEFVSRNFEKTMEVLRKKVGANHALTVLVDRLGDRYALCPASSKKEYYSSFPGGLAFHNLHMNFWVMKFAKDMGVAVSEKEAITVAVLHEIGKIGEVSLLVKDYYLPMSSSWHREKGIYYEINPALSYMRIPHRSIYIAQEVGIKLTKDEYLAILLHETKEEELVYKYKMPPLARVTQFAYQWATQIEKENEVLWPNIY